MAAGSSCNLPFEKTEIATEYKPFEVHPGDVYTGAVIGGVDWCEFYVRPTMVSTELLETINSNMDALYSKSGISSLKELGLLSKGMPCAVRYSKDKKWYRGLVEDPDYKVIRFIDYGNVQLCSENDIKPLARFFMDILPQTVIPCKLTNAQDTSLPSFVNDSKMQVTVIGSSEPYEVIVKILPTSNGAAAGPPWPTPNKDSVPGLSLMPQRPSRAAVDESDEDLKKPRPSANGTSRALPIRSGHPMSQANSRYNFQNAQGIISELYATCAGVRIVKFPAKRFEINTEQSAFCGGPIQVNDLRRIFRPEERIRLNAKLEQPYVTSDMDFSRMVADDKDENKKKMRPLDGEENERWLVTDFKLTSDNPKLLVTHAVVTFVGDQAASLFVRTTGETIWAPKGAFPPHVANSARPLKEIEDVQIGRSVLLRAESTDQLADFKVEVPWAAVAVEFVGVTYEERGWMYLVRDNYSVIITEGNVGFGYVFVPNHFVEAEGIKLEEWYGSRVYFRSCVDVPDTGEETRQGIRMKALRAHLDPNDMKGPYRYPGIYRPQPADDFDDMPAARASEKPKNWVNTDDEPTDLPAEVQVEMRLLGEDTIGIEQPIRFPPSERVIMVKENLLNEMRTSDGPEPEPPNRASGAIPKVPQPNPNMATTNGVIGHKFFNPISRAPNPAISEDPAELRSTVEIFPVSDLPIDWPIPQPAIDDMTNFAPVNIVAPIKPNVKSTKPEMGSQTEMTGELENMKKACLEKALQELRSMDAADLDEWLGMGPHLDMEQRRRFRELWKAAMEK